MTFEKDETHRLLIVVRTYPYPARKGVEVSCTAAVSEDGMWVRLYPLPYRLLPLRQRFSKYQWVDLSMSRAFKDPRIESYNPHLDTISPLPGIIPSADRWAKRKELLSSLVSPSLCDLQRRNAEDHYPTLGLFKPREIHRLRIRSDSPHWTDAQEGRLRQIPMFGRLPKEELEKIPYKFIYEFHCNEPECGGHKLSCTDWEMAETYRKWSKEYGDDWQEKFQQRWEHEMIELNDTHFFVGTLSDHPQNWIIVGVFFPRKAPASPQLSLGL